MMLLSLLLLLLVLPLLLLLFLVPSSLSMSSLSLLLCVGELLPKPFLVWRGCRCCFALSIFCQSRFFSGAAEFGG